MGEPGGAGELEAWIEAGCTAFRDRFGRRPTVLGLAPGRVNLIGEHTDYSEGLVLPCAIDRYTLALAAPGEGALTRVYAADLDAAVEVDPAALQRTGDWSDYVKAVFHALREHGYDARPLDLTIASRVPMAAGLSSSAALGLAVAGAVDRTCSFDLTARALAEIVHHGECGFVGIGCGILDQYASALGQRGHALRIDCRTRDVEPHCFEGDDLGLLVVHSGVERELGQSTYQERVKECRAAILAARHHGIATQEATTLRDLGPDDLPALERVLPPRLFRRTRHVVRENARVDAFCDAMEHGDHAALGALLAAGQRSLRDDYEVSTPRLDALCELALDVPGIVGSRLTGAGLGGCTLHLVRADQQDRARESLVEAFASRFGREPQSWLVASADGARSRLL